MQIPIAKVHLKNKEILSVLEPLKNGWLVQGPKVKQFEDAWSNFTQSKHSIAVTSCTSALQLSLSALNISRGDEVIVPAFTWVSTANVVEHLGGKVVFCDIDLNTFNIDLKQIRKDPFRFVRKVADESGCIVVLKGAPTIIASKEQTIVNTTGHQGLATAGTGDVLSGIMGSFLCQGFSAKEASKLAVFIHGKCADKLLGKKGYRGLIASDLIDVIPSVLANYELGEFYG